MSTFLPTLLTGHAGKSPKPRSPKPHDDITTTTVEGGSPEEDDSIVARSKTEALTFSELQERVRKNDIDDIAIDVDRLDTAQREKLVVRATLLTTTLDRFAEILKSIQVSPEDFEFSLSCATDHIDYFLSHAWATSRWLKLLALLYFQNFRAACVASFVVGACGSALCKALQGSHAFGLQLTAERYKIISAILLMVLPVVAFFLVFVFGARLPGRRIPSIFLDKVCIHQTNVDLKGLGINSLDVFVRKSGRLLVLYDSNTYQRMWCAYETAMFARGEGDSQCRPEDICFVPICAAQMALAVTILPMFALPVAAFIYELTLPEPASAFWVICNNQVVGWSFLGLTIYAIVAFIPESYFVRCCVVDMKALEDTLANFDMNATKCMEENDRKLVTAKIVEAWGSVESFNEFVRDQASQSIARACGGVNYTPMFDIYSKTPTFTWCLFWLAAFNSKGFDYDEHLLGIVIFAVVVVAMCTVRWFRFACLAHSWFPTRPVLCCAVISCLMSISMVLHLYSHNTLWWMAHRTVEKYDLPVSGGILFLPVLSVQLWFVYSHIRVKQLRYMRLHVWNRLDTLYYAVLGTICVTLAGLTNVMEAVHGENVLSYSP